MGYHVPGTCMHRPTTFSQVLCGAHTTEYLVGVKFILEEWSHLSKVCLIWKTFLHATLYFPALYTNQPAKKPTYPDLTPPDAISLGSTSLGGQSSPNHEIWVKSLRLSGLHFLHSSIWWGNPTHLTGWLQASNQLTHAKCFWACLARGLSNKWWPELLLLLLTLLLVTGSGWAPVTASPEQSNVNVLCRVHQSSVE